MSFFSSPFNSFYDNASSSSSHLPTGQSQGPRSLHGSPRPGNQSTWKLGDSYAAAATPWGSSNAGQTGLGQSNLSQTNLSQSNLQNLSQTNLSQNLGQNLGQNLSQNASQSGSLSLGTQFPLSGSQTQLGSQSLGTPTLGSQPHLGSQTNLASSGTPRGSHASLGSNVGSSSLGSHTPLGSRTPLGSHTNLTLGTNLSQSHLAGHLPGIGLAPRPETQWFYLDVEGNEQGPFGSTSMSGWLWANYFPDTLPVRRVEDTQFVALGDLKHYSQVQDPFKATLPPQTWARIFQTPEPQAESDSELVAELGSTTISADSRLAAPGTPVHKSEVAMSPKTLPGAIGTPVEAIRTPVEGIRAETPATVTSPSPVREPEQKKEKRKTKLPEDRDLVELKPKQKQKKKKPTRIELNLVDDLEPSPEPPAAAGLQPFAPPKPATPVAAPAPVSTPTPSAPPAPAWKAAPVASSAVNLKELQQQQRELEKQREDERRKSQAPVSAAAWGAASLGLNSSRRRLSSSADKTEKTERPASVASDSSEVVEEDDDGFMTVSRRGHHGGRGSVPTTPVAPVAAPRNVQPVPMPTQAANPADELVQWAKVSFKQGVSKEVDHMELLEVFLSLPANSDAKEFIADSIYAYSTTLDGRRFAHELLSRRKQAEATFKVGETWKTVLHRANPTMETDPSFKVVTKKRTRPVPRP